MKKNPSRVNKPFELSFHPEALRLIFYILFWIMVLIGVSLTFYYNPSFINNNPVLMQHGINNICIFFDSSPATEVMPSIWCFCFLFVALYCITCTIRSSQMYKANALSSIMLYSQLLVYFVLLIAAAFFSTIFSVHPQHNLMMHTIPFASLIIALQILGWNNLLFYKKRSLSTFTLNYLIIYNLTSLTVTIIYFYMIVNTLTGNHGPNVPYPVFFDRAWLILAAFIPIFNCILLIKNKHGIRIRLSLSMEKILIKETHDQH